MASFETMPTVTTVAGLVTGLGAVLAVVLREIVPSSHGYGYPMPGIFSTKSVRR